jgi:hypothetical protein
MIKFDKVQALKNLLELREFYITSVCHDNSERQDIQATFQQLQDFLKYREPNLSSRGSSQQERL